MFWKPLCLLSTPEGLVCGTLCYVLHEMLSDAITDTEVGNQKNRVQVTGREKKYGEHDLLRL